MSLETLQAPVEVTEHTRWQFETWDWLLDVKGYHLKDGEIAADWSEAKLKQTQDYLSDPKAIISHQQLEVFRLRGHRDARTIFHLKDENILPGERWIYFNLLPLDPYDLKVFQRKHNEILCEIEGMNILVSSRGKGFESPFLASVFSWQRFEIFQKQGFAGPALKAPGDYESGGEPKSGSQKQWQPLQPSNLEKLTILTQRIS